MPRAADQMMPTAESGRFGIKAAPRRGAAGPASAPGLSLGEARPAHAGPHSAQTADQERSHGALRAAARGVVLGVQLSAAPPDLGAYENDGQD